MLAVNVSAALSIQHIYILKCAHTVRGSFNSKVIL